MQDAAGKGRTLKGEKQGLSVLADKEVIEIRNRYAQGGISHRELAKMYGVAHTTTINVVNHRTWNHI
jgi:hypothetical protein